MIAAAERQKGASMSEVLYLQIERNVEVSKRDVTIGDVAEIYCSNKTIPAKVKTIKLLQIPDVKKKRVCVSSMAVIEKITEMCPNVEVNNIGEADFIIDYMKEKPHSKVLQWTVIILVAVFVFIGSMYAIMAYNNDVGTAEIFAKVYEHFGQGLEDSKILEIAYAVGLAAGIIIFYNHFGGKRFGTDPTPIEVEMDKYEKDLDSTLIDRSAAAGKEKNV